MDIIKFTKFFKQLNEAQTLDLPILDVVINNPNHWSIQLVKDLIF
jgi:hypothetical protein